MATSGESKPLSSRDITFAPLLDARVASRCPVRTQLDIDPPANVVDVPMDVAVVARMEAGRTFEDQVMSAITDVHGPIPSFARDPEGARAAMAEGVPLLAQVPLIDHAGRRTGRPDLLLSIGRSTADGRPTYVPVEIKHHLMVTAARKEGEGTLQAIPLSGLVTADLRTVSPDPAADPRRKPDDLFTLAHYHRLLESTGHAGEPVGVVIGSEALAVVLELEKFSFNSWRNFTGRWTTLDAYDREFGFRLDIAVVAAQRAAGQDAEDPLVVPARNSECPRCPWEQVCAPRMESGDEITLLPGISWRERQELRADGITSRTELARQDPGDQRTKSLAAAVEYARMSQAGIAVCRRRNVHDLVLPRADVEVDVDMESTPNGVYLWGNLVSRRDAASTYVPFHDLSEDPDHARVFSSFWTWLMNLRATTIADGKTFAAYFWSPAETRHIRAYAARLDADVEPFVASTEWVDLERVVKRHIMTTDGRTSLKSIAPLAGFAWRDDDASGDNSMLWYDQAVAGDEAARDRLLAYNTDDVQATLAVREWLERVWSDLPGIEDVPPPT